MGKNLCALTRTQQSYMTKGIMVSTLPYVDGLFADFCAVSVVTKNRVNHNFNISCELWKSSGQL